jgi:CheY-like chemotaxis protein
MGQNRKVLVVDDEMDMRIYISRVLQSGGYDPTAVREGSEAIRRARRLAPELIILDVMMPGEGGAETYRRLNVDPDLKRIPVLVASAVKEVAFRHFLKMLSLQEAEKVPYPAAYLEKPFEPEELLATVKKVLRD